MAIKISEMKLKGKRSKEVRSWLKNRLNISMDYKEIYINFYRSPEFINAYGKSIPDSYINKLNDKLKSILEGNSIFIMNNNNINEYHKKNKFRINQIQ